MRTSHEIAAMFYTRFQNDEPKVRKVLGAFGPAVTKIRSRWITKKQVNWLWTVQEQEMGLTLHEGDLHGYIPGAKNSTNWVLFVSRTGAGQLIVTEYPEGYGG